MVLDRALQRGILDELAKAYPAGDSLERYLKGRPDVDSKAFAANLVYLQEHGLVEPKRVSAEGSRIQVIPPKITAKGLDFLADDGGLTAILEVVTVKIHDDTLRQLLAARIDRMPGTEAEKAPLRQALKNLPATAGKALLDKLVTIGVENLPSTVDALGHWIRTLAT